MGLVLTLGLGFRISSGNCKGTGNSSGGGGSSSNGTAKVVARVEIRRALILIAILAVIVAVLVGSRGLRSMVQGSD